jgi:hypothetical protein
LIGKHIFSNGKKVLNERDQRYFSYLHLKGFKENFKSYGILLPDFLFEEDNLFSTLEHALGNLSDKSLVKPSPEIECSTNQDAKYSKIRTIFEKLIIQFHDDQEDHAAQGKRVVSFLVLNFVKAHYGIEIMNIEKGSKLVEKMELMSLSFQLLSALQNLISYVDLRRYLGILNKEDIKYKFGEEILMIYKYFLLLLSNNQTLFSHIPGMEAYCQTTDLNRMKELNEITLTRLMSSKKYYFHL